MNANLPTNQEDQEIDLFQISQSINNFFKKINRAIFNGIQFFIRNWVSILILVIIGFGLGVYLDKKIKVYYSEIIITPNFGSTDYLYSKIDLMNSKIREKDTLFLKEVVGIKEYKNIKSIKIKPITDVYKFIENKPQNFELIKLMSDNGDIEKIIKEDLTSKNYSYHTIYLATNTLVDNKEMTEPILKFLNETEYYKNIQQTSVYNVKIKMIQNDTIISQINSVLGRFSNKAESQKNDKLIYYNENTQLNDIINTKDNLINEQGNNRMKLISFDKVIKDMSTTLNIEKSGFVYENKKYLLPLLFIFIYILIHYFKAFYRKQSLIRQ